MRNQVWTLGPALARAWAIGQKALLQERVPFLPPPVTTPAPPVLICACGAVMDLEMEKDEGRCVNCAFEAADAVYRGRV